MALTDRQKLEAFNRLNKTLPSRELAEELRRIALCLAYETVAEDDYDADLLEEAADILLTIRQIVRGGTKEVRGSRHWKEPDGT